MKLSELSALVNVTHAQYERDRAQVQPILDEESRLRLELQKLARHEAEGRDSTVGLDMMRPFGGDVLWVTWIGRQRRSLNIQLARVLAEKSKRMDELRRAYGRVCAAERLLDQASAARRREVSVRQQDALLETFSIVR